MNTDNYTLRSFYFHEFHSITRIEIVNPSPNDRSGISLLNYYTTIYGPDLVAHRTGGRFGEVVPIAVEDGPYWDDPNPADYVVLVNNDYEENHTDGSADNADDTAIVPGADGQVTDHDLARITLKRFLPGITAGTVQVVLSDPGAVRLFRADGSLLYRQGQTGDDALMLDLAAPSGYLAGLISGDLDIWLEGLHADPDLDIALVYRDTRGRFVVADDVHMLLADWTFRGYDGQPVADVAPVWKEALLAAADAGDMRIGGDPYGSFYKNVIDGLAADQIAGLHVASDEDPSDYYDEEFWDLPGRAVSRYYSALYSADNIYLADPDAPVTSAERAAIRQALGLNVVHNPGATATLVTQGGDVQTRKMRVRPAVQIELDHGDGIYNVGDHIRGSVDFGSTRPGAPRFNTVYIDGISVASGPGGRLPFDYVVTKAGDLTVRVTSTVSEVKVAPISTAGSVLIRVLPAGRTMPVWAKAAWDALRDGGLVAGDPIERNRRISELYAEMYNLVRPMRTVPYKEAVAEVRRCLDALGITPDERMREMMAGWPGDVPGYSPGFYPHTYRAGIRLSESDTFLVEVQPADDGGWLLLLSFESDGEARREARQSAREAAKRAEGQPKDE